MTLPPYPQNWPQPGRVYDMRCDDADGNFHVQIRARFARFVVDYEDGSMETLDAVFEGGTVIEEFAGHFHEADNWYMTGDISWTEVEEVARVDSSRSKA